MKTLKILILLPLSILSVKMTAQIDDLLKNKDITWMAEVFNDFVIDESFEARAFEKPNHVIPLKFVNNKNGIVEERFAMQEWLENAIKSGKLPVFDSEFCTKRRIPYTLIGRDSLLLVDPITYKTTMHVTVPKLHFEFIPLFRAKQVIYYNAKKGQFGMRTLAIAPTKVYKDYVNDSTRILTKVPLFWFKPKDLDKTPRLSKKSIAWARRLNYSKGVSMDKDSLKIIKNTLPTTSMNDFISVFETKPKVPFYQNEGSLDPTKKISFSERKTMLHQIDTLRIVDPVSYDVSYKVFNEKIPDYELTRLQLVQNWYWNNRKKRLEIRLVATAPIREMYRGTEYSFLMPLFYRRTDD
jgi:hypothetical protein